MAQEHQIGAKRAVGQLTQRCYNASNSLEIRACEAIPFSVFRRMTERLRTETVDGEGVDVIICSAPRYGGRDNPISRRSNILNCGSADGHVLAPRVFADDKKVGAELNLLCADCEMMVSVPSLDGGIDASFWFFPDTARKVLQQAAADDNLASLPPGFTRRIQARPPPPPPTLPAQWDRN